MLRGIVAIFLYQAVEPGVETISYGNNSVNPFRANRAFPSGSAHLAHCVFHVGLGKSNTKNIGSGGLHRFKNMTAVLRGRLSVFWRRMLGPEYRNQRGGASGSGVIISVIATPMNFQPVDSWLESSGTADYFI